MKKEPIKALLTSAVETALYTSSNETSFKKLLQYSAVMIRDVFMESPIC